MNQSATNLVLDQWHQTVSNLVKAIHEAEEARDPDEHRTALQAVVSLSESLKSASVGLSTMVGWNKRKETR